MGLRVHFTAEDLARIRIAQGPDPMWEIVLSATLLDGTAGRAVFDPWRAGARSRLRDRLPRQDARLIRYLAPRTGDFPDFLTPVRATTDLDDGIEAVRATPARRLRQDLAVLPAAPTWARPLADSARTALTGLGNALHRYYHAALGPYWPRIQALVDADRTARSRALLRHGVDGLLHSLRPTLDWTPSVLTAPYPVDRDLHLDGRGLLLVPSVFCWRTPVTLIDTELPPVLVYPVAHRPGWCADPAARPGSGSLAALLGTTRASALRAVEDGCTTTELARRTGTTAPTASQHTYILREANLIVSTRHRNTVVHTLTPLGAALLHANT
ncbi:ArsR family transcriptional regulator [Streptomyces sp. NPDC006290]|uniref:ArsR/SmtB family transcription factor n=1 Tax=unclassified Streptomyces TaxID=2593676 RepID=UPI0033B00836